MKVKNIKGTSDNTCNCGSWLEHWRKFSVKKKLPTFCSEKSCGEAPAVGAHVQKDNSNDNSWYIVPLCNAHNKKTASLDLKDVELVSANVKETCGK